MTTPRKNGRKTPLGRPFQPGNPGRPKGARHKTTLAIESLLEGEAEALTRKAIEQALSGDTVALRLCLERLAPARRDSPVRFDLGSLNGPSDALKAGAGALVAMSEGDLTPSEAATVVGLLDQYRKAYEVTELEQRLTALEARK